MSNQEIGITVIIPCYNSEKNIEKCMDSLFACQYGNAEFVLINDKSTDHTAEVIQAYMKRHINMDIKYFDNEDNLGAGATRNKGISYASKEYITFVDSDDYVDIDFFSEINRIAMNHGSDCIIFDAEICKSNTMTHMDMFYGGNFAEEHIFSKKDTLVYIKGCTWGKAYKTSVIKENNIQFANINRNEDLAFTKTAISYCESIYYLSKVLYYYNENPNSLMHNDNLRDKNNAHIAFDLIQKKLSNRGFDEEIHSMYLIEIIYSTTMTCVRKKEAPRKNFRKVAKGYQYRDKYYDGYHKKYRLLIFLFRTGLFRLISLAIEFRSFREDTKKKRGE